MLNVNTEFGRLVEVVAALRHPESGCPWDLEQTHSTLTRYLIEESSELIAAIDRQAWPEVSDELGDVLLQVVLHAEIARQAGRFDLSDVIRAITEKMIRRHPHVFKPNQRAATSAEVVENWTRIKATEGGEKSDSQKDVLGVQIALPALLRALKIGERSAKVQFDWLSARDVFAVCSGELNELSHEFSQPQPSPDRLRAEIGDVLFSAVQLARHLEVDPDHALREACDRFGKRYQKMLQQAADQGLSRDAFEALPASEKEPYWRKAKESEP